MDTNPNQIHLLIQNARAALRRGDESEARRLAAQASRLAPHLEDAWLILTAVSGPRESLQYARRALEINPDSQRARKAVDWARNRPGADEVEETAPAPMSARSEVEASARREAVEESAPKSEKRRSRLFPILLVVLICAAVGLAGWTVSRSFARANILKNAGPSAPTRALEQHFAAADIPKPTYTPAWTFTPTVTFTPTFTTTPSPTPTLKPTDTPLPTDTPAATDTPGMMEAYIVPDTPTAIPPTQAPYTAPTQVAAAPPSSSGSNGTHWIDINLSTQRLFAYEGNTIVNTFIVSTGVAATPTVTGTYKIYARYLYADMHGPGYFLPDVPFTMYFYKSYGIHGTYWHNNFGTPMSHGCVNLSIPDAEWLYYWSTFGTTVKVHY